MTNSRSQITDLRALHEKRERLKLEAKYHRLGLEMHLSKGLSMGSIIETVTTKFVGDTKTRTAPQATAYGPSAMHSSFGVWAIVFPLVAKAISTKITTGKSWREIIAHITQSVIKKFGTG